MGQTYEMNEVNVLYLIISGILERVIVKNDIKPQGKTQKNYFPMALNQKVQDNEPALKFNFT